MISQEINTEVVKDFLRAVYKFKKKELMREENRERISSHIGRIKKIVGKDFDKKKIEEEFTRLENTINEALERERQILEEQRHGSSLVMELKNRLDQLEKKIKSKKEKHESLNQIKLALQRIHEEVKNRKKARKKLGDREKELEEKIKKKDIR